MYLVMNTSGAIVLMAMALVLLGTWAPGQWSSPCLSAGAGRRAQHSFLDFSIANFLAAVLIALTVGQIGADTPETHNFLTQLNQDNWPSIIFAMAGGVALSLGTLATQYGWAFVGLSVTEVVAASLKVVIGTVQMKSSANTSMRKRRSKDLEGAIPDASSMHIQAQGEVTAGTAEFLVALEEKRSIRQETW